MTAWRKTAWWVSGGLAIALLLSVLALNKLFDQEYIKTLVREKSQSAWSRDVTIGDLSWRLLPFPVLRAKNVSVSNPAWAHNKNLLEAENIAARVQLLPLLSGEVIISSVSMDGLKAYLEVADDGRKSWDFRSTAASTKPGTGEAMFDPLMLTALRVEKAQLSYQKAANAATIWQVNEFSAHGKSGWQDVRIDARVTRDEHLMKAKGHFSDLSKLGVQQAVSEGSIDLEWEQARLVLSGKIPLESSLRGHVLKASFAAESMKEPLGFFAVSDRPVAPLKVSADLRDAQGKIDMSDIKISLGQLKVSGNAQVALSGTRPSIVARLTTDHLDWKQSMLDIGRPPLPPKPAGELFRTHPLGWPFLAAMTDIDGTLDADIKSLTMRSGVKVMDLKMHTIFNTDHVNVNAFSLNLLGGAAVGNMQLYAHKKTAKLKFDADNISLEQWITEKGHKPVIAGGPMKINASVSATGASMKELAASLTGPVSIRVGQAKVHSKKMQQAEAMLTGLIPIFSEKDSDYVALSCIGARLPFQAGKANAEPIAGVRSDTSQLLTTGFVDLRRQTLDLRGRVKARSGISLGVSNFAGDVKIAGRLVKPEVSLDPAGTPGALARIGAAIVTGGASILATAIWDAAGPASDPCQIVFAAKGAGSK